MHSGKTRGLNSPFMLLLIQSTSRQSGNGLYVRIQQQLKILTEIVSRDTNCLTVAVASDKVDHVTLQIYHILPRPTFFYRRKNNLAAKKSRDSRRIRENQMRLREDFITYDMSRPDQGSLQSRKKYHLGQICFRLPSLKILSGQRNERNVFYNESRSECCALKMPIRC